MNSCKIKKIQKSGDIMNKTEQSCLLTAVIAKPHQTQTPPTTYFYPPPKGEREEEGVGGFAV